MQDVNQKKFGTVFGSVLVADGSSVSDADMECIDGCLTAGVSLSGNSAENVLPSGQDVEPLACDLRSDGSDVDNVAVVLSGDTLDVVTLDVVIGTVT